MNKFRKSDAVLPGAVCAVTEEEAEVKVMTWPSCLTLNNTVASYRLSRL